MSSVSPLALLEVFCRDLMLEERPPDSRCSCAFRTTGLLSLPGVPGADVVAKRGSKKRQLEHNTPHTHRIEH